MRKLKLQELDRLSVADFKDSLKTPLVLVLDNIRSGLNVGAAFRTADAFALQEIVLCGITAKPPHREILKTAIGATESMQWRYEEEVGRAMTQLKEEGFQVWAVEQAAGSVSLMDFKLDATQKTALVFGNEVEGVSQSVMERVDGAIEVPQYGTKHSLNISVCVGVVVWELSKQYRRQST